MGFAKLQITSTQEQAMAITKYFQLHSSKHPTSGHPIDALSAPNHAVPRYPRGWLSVVVMVLAITSSAAVWLYQKSDEWQVKGPAPARMPEHSVGAANPSPNTANHQIDTADPSLLAPTRSNADNNGKPAEAKKPGEEPPLSEMSSTETPGDQRVPSARAKDSATQSADPVARTYTIQRGDTLSGIAARLYGDGSKWAAIARVNPGVDSARLRVGKAIKLPDPGAFEKQPDER
jgi:LysM repeat protein